MARPGCWLPRRASRSRSWDSLSAMTRSPRSTSSPIRRVSRRWASKLESIPTGERRSPRAAFTPANERTDAVETILVTGATGKLGQQVVHALLERERAIRIASRRPRPTGARPKEWATVSYGEPASLDRALAGVTAIVHCAWSYRGGLDRAVIEAARRVDVPHIVYLSIVGADRIPLGFYRRKLAAERLLEDSGRPFTILRVTQFHDLLWVAFGAL